MILVARIAFGRWGEDPTLDAVRVREIMEGLTRANEGILRARPWLPRIYSSGVRYDHRDPHDPWCDAQAVIENGFGDCDDLAPWRAAELRVRHGIAARVVFTIEQGPVADRWHFIVEHPGGRLEDPSRALGMEQGT